MSTTVVRPAQRTPEQIYREVQRSAGRFVELNAQAIEEGLSTADVERVYAEIVENVERRAALLDELDAVVMADDSAAPDWAAYCLGITVVRARLDISRWKDIHEAVKVAAVTE